METRDASTESPSGDKHGAVAPNGSVDVQQRAFGVSAASPGDDGSAQTPTSSPDPSSSASFLVKPDPDLASQDVGVGPHAQVHQQLAHNAMVAHSQKVNSVASISADGNGVVVTGGVGVPQQSNLPPPPGSGLISHATGAPPPMIDGATQSAATQWGASPMAFGGEMGDGVPPPPPPSSMPPVPGGTPIVVGTHGGPTMGIAPLMGPGAEDPYMQMQMQHMQHEVGGPPTAVQSMGDPSGIGVGGGPGGGGNAGPWNSYADTLNLAPPPNSKQVQRISRGCGTALSNTMVLPTSRKKPNIVKSHLISEPEVLIVYVPENRPTPTLDDVASRSRSTDTRMDDFGITYDYHGEITDVHALTIPQSSFSTAPSTMSDDHIEPPPQQQEATQGWPQNNGSQADVKIDAQGRRLTQRCDICDKWFANTGTLHNHKLRHEGVRRFPCPHCGMAFIFRSGLSRHLRTHSTEKKWQCPDCNKSFREKSNLKIHRRIHTGEKPFKCRYCGRGFTQAAGLKCHENSKIHVWDRQIDFRKFTNVDVNNPPAVGTLVGVANEGWNNNRVSNTLANMPRMRKIPPPPPPPAHAGMVNPHHPDPHNPYGAHMGGPGMPGAPGMPPVPGPPGAPGGYGMPPPPGQQFGASLGPVPGQFGVTPGMPVPSPQFSMGPMDGSTMAPPPPPGMEMPSMPVGTGATVGDVLGVPPMPVPGSIDPGMTGNGVGTVVPGQSHVPVGFPRHTMPGQFAPLPVPGGVVVGDPSQQAYMTPQQPVQAPPGTDGVQASVVEASGDANAALA